MPKPASLAAAITANVRAQGPRCSLALLRPRLAKPDVADLEQALADVTIPAAAIARGLSAVGHQVSALTVQRHRRGECACPR